MIQKVLTIKSLLYCLAGFIGTLLLLQCSQKKSDRSPVQKIDRTITIDTQSTMVNDTGGPDSLIKRNDTSFAARLYYETRKRQAQEMANEAQRVVSDATRLNMRLEKARERRLNQIKQMQEHAKKRKKKMEEEGLR
jgi:CRISPR/Cas system CSM-associated protein Csm2 small subunit